MLLTTAYQLLPFTYLLANGHDLSLDLKDVQLLILLLSHQHWYHTFPSPSKHWLYSWRYSFWLTWLLLIIWFYFRMLLCDIWLYCGCSLNFMAIKIIWECLAPIVAKCSHLMVHAQALFRPRRPSHRAIEDTLGDFLWINSTTTFETTVFLHSSIYLPIAYLGVVQWRIN